MDWSLLTLNMWSAIGVGGHKTVDSEDWSSVYCLSHLGLQIVELTFRKQYKLKA